MTGLGSHLNFNFYLNLIPKLPQRCVFQPLTTQLRLCPKCRPFSVFSAHNSCWSACVGPKWPRNKWKWNKYKILFQNDLGQALKWDGNDQPWRLEPSAAMWCCYFSELEEELLLRDGRHSIKFKLVNIWLILLDWSLKLQEISSN